MNSKPVTWLRSLWTPPIQKAFIGVIGAGLAIGAGVLLYWQHEYFGLKKLPDYLPVPGVHVDSLNLKDKDISIHYRVLNMDNAILLQTGTMDYMEHNLQLIQMIELGPPLRMECSFRLWHQFESKLTELTGKETDDELTNSGPLITFYGSNDFHHLTLALVKRFRQPFNLIMFDNHPDWVEWCPGLHCGSWLNHASNLPTVQQVFHLGGYSGEFEDKELAWLTPWKLLVGENPKIKVMPTYDTFQGGRWSEVNQQTLREKWHIPITRQRLLTLFAPYKDALKQYPLYITLDKDVMARIYTLQNWNSGQLTLDELLLVIDVLIELSGGRLLGMDIMGDFTKVEVSGIYRAYLHKTQHEDSENNISQAKATTLNQQTNLRILKSIKTSIWKATDKPLEDENPK